MLVGLFASCAGFALLGACAIGVVLAPGKDFPVTDADREVVVRATDLEGWLSTEVDETLAKMTKKRDLFGTYELEYEYDGDGLYVTTIATFDKTESDARTTFSMSKIGFGVGLLSEQKMQKVERNDLFSGGDKSVVYELEMDGTSVGNAVLVRKDARTLFVIFVGPHIDDADELAELLDPHLFAMEAWKR